MIRSSHIYIKFNAYIFIAWIKWSASDRIKIKFYRQTHTGHNNRNVVYKSKQSTQKSDSTVQHVGIAKHERWCKRFEVAILSLFCMCVCVCLCKTCIDDLSKLVSKFRFRIENVLECKQQAKNTQNFKICTTILNTLSICLHFTVLCPNIYLLLYYDDGDDANLHLETLALFTNLRIHEWNDVPRIRFIPKGIKLYVQYTIPYIELDQCF